MQTAEKDSRFPFVGPDPPATPRNTDTRILTLCASPMCVHTHTHRREQMVEGLGVGSGGLHLPRQAVLTGYRALQRRVTIR